MKKITARRIGVVVGFLVLIGAFALSRLFSEMKEPPQRKQAFDQTKEVDTLIVHNGTVPTTLEVQGQLVAYDKIDIFAEVSGTLIESARPFKVGSYFPEGSVLIRVDDEEARLSLLSQKSSFLNAITQLMPDLKIDYPQSYEHWKTYLEAFELEQSIKPFPEPADKQEKYFIASRNLYSQFFNIKSAEERLTKYSVVAPFAGVLTQTSINPGGLVRAGQKLGELMNTASYELEVTVPLADLYYLKIGSPVQLRSDDIAREWKGRVKRINDQVDPTTQTVKVFISVDGRELREGMYLRGEVLGSDIAGAMEIPRDLLIDQTAVYEVQDSVLILHQVEVVKMTDQTAVIRGLKDGTPLLRELIPGTFEGMKVKIKGASSAGQSAAPSTTSGVGG